MAANCKLCGKKITRGVSVVQLVGGQVGMRGALACANCVKAVGVVVVPPELATEAAKASKSNVALLQKLHGLITVKLRDAQKRIADAKSMSHRSMQAHEHCVRQEGFAEGLTVALQAFDSIATWRGGKK